MYSLFILIVAGLIFAGCLMFLVTPLLAGTNALNQWSDRIRAGKKSEGGMSAVQKFFHRMRS